MKNKVDIGNHDKQQKKKISNKKGASVSTFIFVYCAK